VDKNAHTEQYSDSDRYCNPDCNIDLYRHEYINIDKYRHCDAEYNKYTDDDRDAGYTNASTK
jgi:hypothetical protein